MVWQSKVNKEQIHPGLVMVMNLVHERLEAAGMPFKTYWGLRTFAEQNELYAKGRTTDGSIVTKAKGGQSMHNYGLATDSAPLLDPDDPKGAVHWPDPDKAKGAVWWQLEADLLRAVEYLNITRPAFSDYDVEYEWGGRWRFRDVPHIQVRTTVGELRAGMYPYCDDVEWLVKAHTTFLFDTPWIWLRIQFLLNMQSYDAGLVDGDFGSRTFRAWNQFRMDQQIPKDDNGSRYNRTVLERLVRLHQTAMPTPRGDFLTG